MWQTLGITDTKRKQRTSIEHGLSNEEARRKIKTVWGKQVRKQEKRKYNY